jgi:hypothetical protein
MSSICNFEAVEARLQASTLPPIEALYEIYHEFSIPKGVFETLACRWARQALEEEVRLQREPDTRLWTALDLKEQSLTGDVDEEALLVAHQAARQAAHEASVAGVGFEAASAVADASGESGYAMRAVAWATAAKVHQAPSEQEEAIRKAEGKAQIDAFLELLRAAL